MVFYPDSTGYTTLREGSMEAQITSSLRSFNWAVNDNLLQLNFDNKEIIKTKFSVNNDGQLFLSDFTDLYFNKLD